jgi:predicted MFS family arabinose efflux permease
LRANAGWTDGDESGSVPSDNRGWLVSWSWLTLFLGGPAQFHSGSPRFRKTNRDRLLGGTGAMLAFSNVMHFFSHKFSSLRTGRLAFARIFLSAFEGFFFRHKHLQLQPNFAVLE